MSNDTNSPTDASNRGRTVVDIDLRDDRAQQFEHLKSRLTRRLGFEPSNAEVLGLLMATHRDES